VSACPASHLAALVPCHRDPPATGLLRALRRTAGAVLVVDDGMPGPGGVLLARRARALGCEVLSLPRNRGKGHAVAAGIAALLARPSPPEAVIVLDADGQHPPEAVPAFLAAATHADLVVGDRFGDLRPMPPVRRLANRSASALVRALTGAPVRDSQCGMRLLRGRALHEVPFPPGGFEAETRHLTACLRAGLPVAWVPIPARYGDEVSSFRPLRDSARVVAAALAAGRPAASGRTARADAQPISTAPATSDGKWAPPSTRVIATTPTAAMSGTRSRGNTTPTASAIASQTATCPDGNDP
jgi:hypothetical protein